MKKILFLFGATFLLSACSPVYETHYSYIPPHTWRAKQCVNQCLTQRSYCKTACQSAAQNCRTEADLEAMPAYLLYDKEQRKAGQPDFETVSDFADYSNCNESCGCASAYRACFTNCGGTVIANTQCVAFCKGKSQ